MPVYKKNTDEIMWPQYNVAYTRFMNTANWCLHS